MGDHRATFDEDLPSAVNQSRDSPTIAARSGWRGFDGRRAVRRIADPHGVVIAAASHEPTRVSEPS
jgi:hypothetical protein